MNWAFEGRAKWPHAAALNLDLMYKGNGTIEMKVTISPRTPDGE